MDWVGLLAAALGLLKAWVGWLASKKLIEGATASAIAKNLQDSSDVIEKARKARQTVRDQHTSDPGSIMRDDKFTRRDD